MTQRFSVSIVNNFSTLTLFFHINCPILTLVLWECLTLTNPMQSTVSLNTVSNRNSNKSLLWIRATFVEKLEWNKIFRQRDNHLNRFIPTNNDNMLLVLEYNTKSKEAWKARSQKSEASASYWMTMWG